MTFVQVTGIPVVAICWQVHMISGPGIICIDFLFQVKVTRCETPDSPEITIRELKKGDFFGEKALLG